MADTKARKFSLFGGLRRVFWVIAIIYIIVNPLGAAMIVHNVATWAIDFVNGTFS